MAWSDRKLMRIHSLSVLQLVKRISESGTRKDIMSLPETEVLWHRTPEELKDYLARVIYELREPWRLRGAPKPQTDRDFFNHWVGQRDRNFPDLNPNYNPPEGLEEIDPKEESDGGSDGTPPPRF